MKKSTKNYINNKDFYDAIVSHRKSCQEAIEQGKEPPRIPDYIGVCIMTIANRLSLKPCFRTYSYRDEMILDAIENCFHRSTKVMTLEHGIIEIEKIVGQTVTVRARDGVWREAKVKSYGKQMLYEYGFGARNKSLKNINQTVICTKDHRWFVRCRLTDRKLFQWKDETITDLRIGDMLENAKYINDKDATAVVHGLIFGDGSADRSSKNNYNSPVLNRQGKDYARIRICKKDFVKDEIIDVLNKEGYPCTYPKSANGDPVYYLGKFPFCKEIPFTTDPSYISGFIHGWWLADGTKKTRDGMKQISTIDKDAAEWLMEYCAYAGYHVLSHRVKVNRVGCYDNAKPLHIVTLGHDTCYRPRVKYIKEFGEDEVFCLEEPVTSGFVLANGLLTGNCFTYYHDFDPFYGLERGIKPNPFAYFTQVVYFAFLRRLYKEEKNRYIIYKNFHEVIGPGSDTSSLVDSDNKSLMPAQMYDNIGIFMEKFEKKEALKNQKRRPAKLLGLDNFYEKEL